MKKHFLFFLLLFLCSATALRAQLFVSDVSKRGTTAAPFLTIGQGARALGMGSAFVAVANDQSAMFWNVAGIARLNNAGFLVDHTKWLADINYNFLAATYSIGDFGTIGMSFITSDIDEMAVTTVQDPEGTGESFGVTDAAFSLGWAINLTDNFSIGFNPKFVYQSIWNMSASAFAIDMGVLYNTPFDGITLGMAITNFSPMTMTLSGNNSVILYDPNVETTGNNSRIPAALQMDGWSLPLNFRVGVAYNPIRDENNNLLIAVDAMHPNNDYESVSLGAEYTFLGQFSLRGGMTQLFQKDSEELFTFGAGVRQLLLGNLAIRFDYSYQSFGRLNDTQKFSVGITF